MPTSERVVFPEPEVVELETHEVDEPGPGEVLVRTERTLVSTGTELTALSGDYPEGSHWDDVVSYPFVPGYDNVGTVVATGEGAAEWEGRRVATPSDHARYVVTDAEHCRAVPEAVESDDASFFTLAEIAMNGVRRGRVDWGESVVVYGVGLIGQLAARACHAAGARPVVGVDLAEGRLDRLPGGALGVDPREREPAEVVRDEDHGRLADVVIEATGNPEVVTDELAALREQGRLVLLSSPRGETTLDLHDHLNAPSYELIGAHNASHPPVATPQTPWTRPRHTELFFDYLAEGRVAVDGLVSHREPYDRAPALYEQLLADRSEAMGVLLEWD